MKIDRLFILGFGKLAKRRIAFDPRKVNLLIEENEFGKSTIAAALNAALYGFPPRERSTAERLSEKESHRPLSGGDYKVSVDLEVAAGQGRVKLRVVRDFGRGEVQVFNLSEGGKEVTRDFIQQRGELNIGPRLLNLSRDQFLNTCYVRQGALQRLADLSYLTDELQRIADTESGTKTAAEAIRALDAALARYPESRMGKGTLHIANEISRARDEVGQVEEALQELESKREAIQPELDRIKELQRQIEAANMRRVRAIYLGARVELDDVNRELERRQDLETKKRAVEAEKKALETYQAFPAAQRSNLEQWLGELNQSNAALKQKEEELTWATQERDEVNRSLEGLANLSAFTRDDYEKLIWIVSRYEEAAEKLSRADGEFRAASTELAEKGMTLGEFDTLQEQLQALSSAQREEAANDNRTRQLLESGRVRYEDKANHQKSIMEQVDREREQREGWGRRLLSAFIVALVVAIALFFFHQQIGAMVVSMVALLTAGLGLYLRQAAKTHRVDERVRAQIEANRAQDEVRRICSELQQHDDRMEALAQSAGFQSAESLARASKRYFELNTEVQVCSNLRASVRRLQSEVQRVSETAESFFQRAGRSPVTISKQAIEALKRDVKRFLDLSESRTEVEKKVRALRTDVEGQRREINDCVTRITNLLRAANITEYDTLDAGIRKFREGVDRYERLLQIQDGELPRLRQALAEVAEKGELVARKERILKRLEALENANLDLASLSPEKESDEYTTEVDRCQQMVNRYREEISKIEKEVVATLNDIETRRPQLQERQEELSRHLQRVLAFKDSVELAKQTFERIGKKLHTQWADSLSEGSRELLSSLNTPYTALHFDSNLNFTVSMKGRPDPLQLNQLRSQVSVGAREQLVLLTRLVVSRYLSRGSIHPPLILDEPFASSDDDRFTQLMGMILNQLSQEHQVIIFSCHQQRHKWLESKLSNLFSERVHQCVLEDLPASEASD